MAKMVNYNRQGYKTPMPVLDPAERAHTFAEVSLGYNAERAVNEARRAAENDAASTMQKLTGGLGLPF